MQRPTGIAILAALLILLGFLSLFGGLTTFAAPSQAVTTPIPYVTPAALGVAYIVVGALGLIVGYGLWFLKGWAWILAIVVVALRVVLDVVGLFSGSAMASFAGLVVSAVVLWYLFRPEVKRAFGRA